MGRGGNGWRSGKGDTIITHSGPWPEFGYPLFCYPSLVTPLSLFHPAVAAWFERSFAAPTAAQAEAWPAIQAGRHVLIAAPTGSGKTLAAFLAAIDGLVRQGLAGELARRDAGRLRLAAEGAVERHPAATSKRRSPASARRLRAQGLPDVEIRTWVRTGDTPPGERQRCAAGRRISSSPRPESLYILLGSRIRPRRCWRRRAPSSSTKSTRWRRTSAARISPCRSSASAALCGGPLLRIGLSATQKPIETVARFLVGAGRGRARLHDHRHRPSPRRATSRSSCRPRRSKR